MRNRKKDKKQEEKIKGKMDGGWLTVEKMNRKGIKKEVRQATERPLAALLRVVLCCCRQIGLRYFCVGVGNVGREIRRTIITVEGFTGGVLPGAVEPVTLADKFKVGAGGQAGEGRAVIEHIDHISYI